MAPSEPSDASTASSSSKIALSPEEKQKYEEFLIKYPAMRSITEAPPIPDGLFYKPNSELNPLVISDDSEDDYEHPFVELRPLQPSDFEAAWDAPILQENNQDSIEQVSDSESTISEESTTTTYSSDGGFVVDDEAHDVFLHNHDPDFDPGSDSSSQDAVCAQVDEADSADDGADADEESDDDGSDGSPPAKKIRRDSAGF